MNRLKDSASAYLLQHAQDPVHWQPWGTEAFQQAKTQDKPVFISIGYAACHWCHVMARESFRDFHVAEILNENFVSIKVDREEHPQVDERYMSATQLMTGQGGWPMSVFALPDGQVFYAGTYFPPEPRRGQPSFTQLLESILNVWKTNREELAASAAKITAALKEEAALNQRILTAELPGPDVNELFGENLGWQQLAQVIDVLGNQEDTKNAGFGSPQGPKFPPSPSIGLLNAFLAAELSEGDDAQVQQQFEQAKRTATGIRQRLLDTMAQGALYDHSAGGFFRYTVDGKWQLPHFEKMLFDNVYLLQGYATAAEQTGDYFYKEIARGTAQWLVNDLQLSHGGFASSLEADSEVAGFHVEGGYYIYSDEELESAAEQAQVDTDVLSIRGGSVVPEATSFTDELTGAKTVSLKQKPSEEQLVAWRTIMDTAAAERVQDPTFLAPSRDEKVVASWNGQAILALLDVHLLWPENGFDQAALKAAEYLWSVHVGETKLGRTSFDGKISDVEGTLSDYAQTIRAFLAMYRHTGDTQWWDRANTVDELVHRRLVTDEVIREVSGDDVQVQNLGELVEGDYWATPLDDTEPSGTSRYVLAQWELNVLRGEGATESDHITRLISFALTSGTKVPSHLGGMLQAAARLLSEPKTLLIRGQGSSEQVEAERWAVANGYLPVVVSTFGGGAPVAEQASAIEAGPLLLRCTGSVCLAPLSTPEELA